MVVMDFSIKSKQPLILRDSGAKVLLISASKAEEFPVNLNAAEILSARA